MDVAAHSTRSDSSAGRSQLLSGGRKARAFPEGSEEARSEWALWLREHLLCSASSVGFARTASISSVFLDTDGSIVGSILSGSSRKVFAEAAVFFVSGASVLAYLSAIHSQRLKPPDNRSVRSAAESEARALEKAGDGPVIAAQSARIRLTRGEAMALAAALVDPTSAQARGLAVGNERFWPLLVTHECLFACEPSAPDEEILNGHQLPLQHISTAPKAVGPPAPTVASIITNMGLVSGHPKAKPSARPLSAAPLFVQKESRNRDTEAEDSDKEADAASATGSMGSNEHHAAKRKSDLEVRRRHLFVARAQRAYLVAISNDAKEAGAQLNYLCRLAAFLSERRI